MLNNGVAAIALAALFVGLGNGPIPNCNEERSSGPFDISTHLNSSGGRYISISYAIPARQASPRYTDTARFGPPTIVIEYQLPFSENGYAQIRFLGFDQLFDTDPSPVWTSAPFPIRSMTMRCGPRVILVGDVSRQPFPLNGGFDRDSVLRTGECVAGLRRFGTYQVEYEELQGEMRTVRVGGRADFASAMRQGERMVRRGLNGARSGRCHLNPPVPPAT